LAGAYEAVRLFEQRAQGHRPDFALTAQNARAVAEVCARLDGIPLAIELAAARAESLSVEAIAARLDDCFRLLTEGARDSLPRQRTLRAALDWSYDLLQEGERTLLGRLSVFAAGCTLEAAEAVCAGESMSGALRLPEVLDLLGRLVGKSLVQAQEAGGEVRYGLLETVRQYGAERLAAAGEVDATRDRHLAYFLALAEGAEPELKGPERERRLARMEAEHDNLRAALAWAGEQGAAELGLRLAGSMWRFWSVRGYFSEGRGWLERALAAGPGSPAARARALNAAGDLAAELGDFGREVVLQEEALALWRALGDRRGIAATLNRIAWVASLQGDFSRAWTVQEECLVLQRELGDRWDIAYSLNHLGWVAAMQGHYGRALALAEEAMAHWRALGDNWGVARSLNHLGWMLSRQGDLDRAAALLEQGLVCCRELSDRAGIAASLGRLGWVVGHQGDLSRAAALLEECLALQRALEDRRGIARSLSHLGWVLSRQGDRDRAAALLAESLRLSLHLGARDLLAEGLESLAYVAVARGQPLRAARLGGAAEALREALGTPLLLALRAGHERAVQAMRAALGEQAFAGAWAEGRAQPLEELIPPALDGHTDGG
jgi:tetratricopeptide (TPR) repeat protein